jgi:hypothetical protein
MKLIASLIVACVTAQLQAQSVGSYVQVSSQSPFVVLGYAKVLSNDGSKLTVQSKSDTYTFNLKDVEIRPGTKPTSQFIAYTSEAKAPNMDREIVTHAAPALNRTANHTPATLATTAHYAPGYSSSGPTYPANFTPNVVMQQHPNYNSNTLRPGETVNIQSLGLNMQNAQVVSLSANQLTVKVPGQATPLTFDSQSLGVLNITQQAAPSQPVAQPRFTAKR